MMRTAGVYIVILVLECCVLARAFHLPPNPIHYRIQPDALSRTRSTPLHSSSNPNDGSFSSIPPAPFDAPSSFVNDPAQSTTALRRTVHTAFPQILTYSTLSTLLFSFFYFRSSLLLYSSSPSVDSLYFLFTTLSNVVSVSERKR
ncbi:hypothetical protein TL16_g02989 [Triparma laevis f. inornata]|uniref:Uncharacterized protein n=1 Tax=Triparma laevis f. inornata TaxID=1714386 RepID=A0A9W7DYU5_9STRA|nr:hypothetical protein TL16_g02989 [Triparma laevis f. inornata]